MPAVPVVRSVEQARALARRLYSTSPGFQTAFVNGYRAGRAGKTAEACPYLSGSRRRVGSSWRPAWRAAWMRGFGHGVRARGHRD